MKTKDIKKNINNEMESMISSNFDSVISRIEKKKGVIIEMEKEKNNKRVWGLSLSFATILLIIAGIVGVNYFNRDKVNLLTTVIFDVNPSLELKVNEEEKIVEVITHNKEAKEIIKDMNLKDVDIDVGTNAILGAMLKQGYIDETKNSILVTVVGDDEVHNKELQERIMGNIDDYFVTNNVDGAVMSQVIKDNKEIELLAKEYNITKGKAELINKIVSSNPMYTFEDLAKLSTNELNLLATSTKNDVTNITTSGKASEKEYIGKNKAKEIAFNKAGVKEEKVTELEVELDLDNGIMVYDIEFHYNGYEYDYEISAIDGSIIKSDKDSEFDYEKKETTTTGNYISKDKAKQVALDHAKVTNYYDYDIEFDYDDGYAIYEIDFETDTKEYEYTINAKTGEILYHEVESENNNKPSTNTTQSTSNLITKGKAKSIALEHAGVTKYFDYDIELDNDKGTKVYEIDFETVDYEYEYEINAENGKIITFDKERKDLDD